MYQDPTMYYIICHNMQDRFSPHSDGMINTALQREDGILSKNTPSNPDIATDVSNEQCAETTFHNMQD
jgi:hypothetical protein